MNQATLNTALELQKEIATVKQFLADENIVVLASSSTVTYRCRNTERMAVLDMMHARLRELQMSFHAL